MEPRIASRTPRACAGCYGQHHDRIHVDFMAAIDGPVVNTADPRVGRIDWVVLCEKCVRVAYELLPEQDNEREQLKRSNSQLHERCTAAETFADTLEDSLGRIEAARLARHTGEGEPTPAKAARRNRYSRGS